jgi:hypothetical protein
MHAIMRMHALSLLALATASALAAPVPLLPLSKRTGGHSNCGSLTPIAARHCPLPSGTTVALDSVATALSDNGLLSCNDGTVTTSHLCRGDGVCGTLKTKQSGLNNCPGIAFDVYRKVVLVHAHNAVCDWQGYLDRYPDLKAAFGATNTAAAQDHYYRHGQKEARDCTSSATQL